MSAFNSIAIRQDEVTEVYKIEDNLKREESHSCEEHGGNNESEDVDAARLRVGNREWCGCGNCLVMSTEQESIFCQEMDVLGDNLEGKSGTFTSLCEWIYL